MVSVALRIGHVVSVGERMWVSPPAFSKARLRGGTNRGESTSRPPPALSTK
jgi:hypothetical protein